ncbi:polyprotein [Cucumis melo var. makuwa]|uniref:Polyprotein n=1 Tax=Cucumis melo var. makuwa TaxID=1194695 RepID=A0A5A7U9B4_CUCMM|nr:polyprotein [Cucumis melo var. makuwa]TYJ98214.1 polyprotein [Cucumis melo var. makuwa]
MTVLKLLNWSELTCNPVWTIEHATVPRTRQSSTTQIIEYDGHVEVQFQEEPHQPPNREICSGRSSISEYRPTTRERPITKSNSMRMLVDFEQSIPDEQYEKSEGSLSPTQTAMERRSGNIYNQINTITLEGKALYDQYYEKYIDQYINQKNWDNRPKFLSKTEFIARVNQKAKEASVRVINKPLTWRTTTGKEILSEYPPEEEASFPHPKMPSATIVFSLYKTIDEEETKTNHYKRPSPPDLGWDDLCPGFRSFDRNNIETWNIDGCSEGQMMIIFQEMFVAATSYLRRMSQREIVDALTAGFTRNLRSW